MKSLTKHSAAQICHIYCQILLTLMLCVLTYAHKFLSNRKKKGKKIHLQQVGSKDKNSLKFMEERKWLAGSSSNVISSFLLKLKLFLYEEFVYRFACLTFALELSWNNAIFASLVKWREEARTINGYIHFQLLQFDKRVPLSTNGPSSLFKSTLLLLWIILPQKPLMSLPSLSTFSGNNKKL